MCLLRIVSKVSLKKKIVTVVFQKNTNKVDSECSYFFPAGWWKSKISLFTKPLYFSWLLIHFSVESLLVCLFVFIKAWSSRAANPATYPNKWKSLLRSREMLHGIVEKRFSSKRNRRCVNCGNGHALCAMQGALRSVRVHCPLLSLMTVGKVDKWVCEISQTTK